jgi:Zn-finger nucleic acid-binding protein
VLPEQLLQALPAQGAAQGAAQGKAALYRRCPACRKHMNRSNFGHKSGVVIDACKDHGLWFDAQELGTILDWIKRGGEVRARRRMDAERQHTERQKRIPLDPTARFDLEGQRRSTLAEPSDALSRFLGSLFDL